MTDDNVRLLVVAAAVSSGGLIGFLMAMQQAKRHIQRVVQTVVMASVSTTSAMATAYVDLAMEHQKLTEVQAMQQLMAKLSKAGLDVVLKRIPGGKNVDPTK